MSDESLRDKLASQYAYPSNDEHDAADDMFEAFIKGWEAAKDNDEVKEALLNQLSDMKESFMQFQSEAQRMFDSAKRKLELERDELRAEVERLKTSRAMVNENKHTERRAANKSMTLLSQENEELRQVTKELAEALEKTQKGCEWIASHVGHTITERTGLEYAGLSTLADEALAEYRKKFLKGEKK